ncbi:hypothetical protein YC2023_029712 [Brassica napus]
MGSESDSIEEKAAAPMKFRNYVPQDKEIQDGKVRRSSCCTSTCSGEEREDPFVNIAPKKPNWDLRRDVQKKLDKLERRTQKAMYKLTEEHEKERETVEADEKATES